MPEIWLRYGTTDVVLDIRFENLANQISSTFQMLPDQEVKTAITSSVPLTDKMLFLALSGFAGAPTTLLRNLLAEQMSEAFKARKDNRPAPGIEGGPLRVATSAVEGTRSASIELVTDSDNVAGIHTGSIEEAFDKTIAQLQSISTVEAELVKCSIIS